LIGCGAYADQGAQERICEVLKADGYGTTTVAKGGMERWKDKSPSNSAIYSGIERTRTGMISSRKM
jgi:hypothetical protein